MLCIHYFLIKRKKLFGRPNIKKLQDIHDKHMYVFNKQLVYDI